MKFMKIARCASVVALICSAQAYAAPVDSDPTAVNFNGNVTSTTCAIEGSSANQIIAIPDQTILEATALPVGGTLGAQVDTAIVLVGCQDFPSNSAANHIKLIYSGTAGTANGGKSFEQTAGTGRGVDFGLKQSSQRLDPGGIIATNTFGDVTPGVGYTAFYKGISTTDAVPERISVPVSVGLYRNSAPVASGDVSMLATISIVTP